jgi:hypothetical protein
MKLALSLCLFAFIAMGQTATPAATSSPSVPSYFSTTGARYGYYQESLTETTNLGIRMTNPCTVGASGATSNCQADTPAGLWTVVSVDATSRSQSSTAALRVGARYFLKSVASGNLIVYANIQAGATTSTTSAVAAATSSSTTAILANLQGGIGFVWRACHTFNKNSKVNCIVDLDYEINTVTSQAVQPLVGLFVGLAF